MLATRAVPARVQSFTNSNKCKGRSSRITPFTFGGGGGSLSLRCRSTDLRFAAVTLPFGRGFSLSPIPINAKGATLSDHPFHIWWRRREFESSLPLDRPPLRCGHPSLRARVQLSQPLKTKKGHLTATLFCFWWRRRELNPRPPVLCLWLYMLSFR